MQTQEERQHRSRRGNATRAASFQDEAEDDLVLASFISQDEFDKFKDKIAANKIELETFIKTSTSSLQAGMLVMAQSFKGIMAECAATVAADSKAQIAQAVVQAVKDNDGGGRRSGRRNRGDDRRRNDRRGDDRRDDQLAATPLAHNLCSQQLASAVTRSSSQMMRRQSVQPYWNEREPMPSKS